MPIHALVLGAGYGTRLQRDIEQDESGEFAALIGCPKPLLPIGGRPLLSHWMDQLKDCDDVISDVSIVTNSAYVQKFSEWRHASGLDNVNIIDDGTQTNESRLGALADIELVARQQPVACDFLIIGGDTLFHQDFQLKTFLSEYNRQQSSLSHDLGALASAYTCTEDAVHRHGIVEVDADGIVTQFMEKPQPHQTQSRLACPCFYVFTAKAVSLLTEFLHATKDQPLAERDAPGKFLPFLSSRLKVVISTVTGRFDVGNLATYKSCNEYFAAHVPL